MLTSKIQEVRALRGIRAANPRRAFRQSRRQVRQTNAKARRGAIKKAREPLQRWAGKAARQENAQQEARQRRVRRQALARVIQGNPTESI